MFETRPSVVELGVELNSNISSFLWTYVRLIWKNKMKNPLKMFFDEINVQNILLQFGVSKGKKKFSPFFFSFYLRQHIKSEPKPNKTYRFALEQVYFLGWCFFHMMFFFARLFCRANIWSFVSQWFGGVFTIWFQQRNFISFKIEDQKSQIFICS